MNSDAEHFQELAAHIDTALWLIDLPTFRLLYVSPAFEHLWGWKPDPLDARPDILIDSVHPQDRERVMDMWHKDPLADHVFQYKIVKPDNAIRWIEEKRWVIRDPDGKSFRLATAARDITSAREEREILEFTNARLQAIVDNTTALISLKAVQGRYILVNRQFEKLFGIPKREILGKTDFDLFPKDAGETRRQHDQRLLDNHEPFEVEELITLPEGPHTYLSARFPIYDAQGFLYGLGNISTDISERKRTERELQDTQRQLIQAAKMESVGRLAAGAAHEVKNPLAILLQGVDFLAKHVQPGDPHSGEILKTMEDAVRRADAVIKDLLEFSGPSRLIMADENLNALIEKALHLIHSDLDRKHIIVDRQLDPGEPLVCIDKNRIQQVFINLLINAVDATRDGGKIIVRTQGAPDSTSVESARVEIDNFGESLPPEVVNHLFEPFVTTKRNRGGTGMGLSIIKNIMETHHGQFDIRNLDGGGVRARVTFNRAGEGAS